MAFTIPNKADASFVPQAEPDSGDLEILARAAAFTGVISGCGVTTAETDLDVDIAAGTYAIDGVNYTITPGSVTCVADSSNPRFALVYVTSSGTPQITHGTAAKSPVFPSVPGSSVVLAAIWIQSADTIIETEQIVDKRVLLYTNLDVPGTLDVTGAATFDSDITLAMGSQDYLFTDRGNALSLQGQSAGVASILDLFSADGDGTDDVEINVVGIGTPSQTTNVERLQMKYESGGPQFEIFTEANGTGTVRDLVFYTEGNDGQWLLGADGTITSTSRINITAGQVAHIVFQGQDLGSSGGTKLQLGRNSNGSTPAGGNISFYNLGNTNYRVWADTSGLLRIMTGADPTNANDTAGSVIGDQSSDVRLKRDVRPYIDTTLVRSRLLGLDIESFRFIDDSRRGDKLMTGLVIREEDRGAWWVMNGAHPEALAAIDATNLCGHLVVGWQDHETRIAQLESLAGETHG